MSHLTVKNNLGQYFTTHKKLQEKVVEFILNNPSIVLEPCIGQGDLITCIREKIPNITFDMYEIDTKIQLLENIQRSEVVYGDFLKQVILKKYRTIVGNPPYIRTTKGNLYIEFTEKCFDLLDENGELIFIVPSDFLKLTSASALLNKMMSNGTFTHIFHPNNEKMFKNASIDVIIFRYCKNRSKEKEVLYNNKKVCLINSNGLITFGERNSNVSVLIQDYFDVYVGLVSGKEQVYKNKDLGNIKILNGKDKSDKYIYLENFPSQDEKINEYLLLYKDQLLQRKIRRFNEKNWFEWGAPRNMTTIKQNMGKDCIYIYNLTRKLNVSFVGKVSYFGGSLIMLLPKKKCNLDSVVSYINSNTFKDNFMFSGRFKIGHRQICNHHIPPTCL